MHLKIQKIDVSTLYYLPRNARLTDFGFGGHCIDTAVTTPSVPSEPMKRFFKSYPVLSLGNVDKQSIIVPSAKTYRIDRIMALKKDAGNTKSVLREKKVLQAVVQQHQHKAP